MIHRLLVRVIRFSLLSILVVPGVLYAAPWLPFGPDGGDARRFAADPHDQAHLFLGTANGWIYETRNFGVNWHRVARVGKRDDLVLDSIVVDPANPKHLLVGAWVLGSSDGGMFISFDGGLTWINQAEMRGQSVRSMAISLSDPRSLVAGSLQGVFRSTDAGQHWKRISPPDSAEIHEVESVAIDPVDPNIIYAGTWHLPWKTTDGGEHWDNIKDGIIDDSDVFSIIVDPTAPKVVYASACSGIYKSEDAGLLFHKVQGIPNNARRTRVLKQDPNDRKVVFAGTTEGLFRSEDAGRQWAAKTGTDIIVNDVAVSGTNSNHILVATDRGGVMASDDGGDTFHPSNGGFSTRQITTMKRDSLHPATIYVGVVNDKEWGGVFRSDNGGLNWKQESKGLGGRDVFALGQAADGAMIAGTSHGIFRMDEGTEEWKRINDAPDAKAPVTTNEAARPVSIGLRPPVPIGRNHFAERRSTLAKPTERRGGASIKTPVRGRAPAKAAGTTRQAQLLAAKKKATTNARPGSAVRAHTAASPAPHAPARSLAEASHTPNPTAPRSEVAVLPPSSGGGPAERGTPASSGFDGSVYVLATSARVLLAATSAGLLSSSDEGVSWAPSGPRSSVDWRFMAAAKQNVVAASSTAVQFSSDSGASWVPIQLPETMTRVTAVAVEPSGAIWLGGHEGVFVSSDGGTSWTTPKNLYVSSVASLYYDETTDRVTVTSGAAGSYNGIVFTVQLPQKSISYTDAGWTLRFARPVGDHLVAATLFDGMVVQPKMLAPPVALSEAAAH